MGVPEEARRRRKTFEEIMAKLLTVFKKYNLHIGSSKNSKLDTLKEIPKHTQIIVKMLQIKNREKNL